MDEIDTTTGETLAEVKGAPDVTVVNTDDDSADVQLPDGSVVTTDSNGVDKLRDADWSRYEQIDWTKPPWEPDDPDPSPLDPRPNDTIGTFNPQPRTVVEFRYKCPECEGMFKSFHRESGGVGEDDTYYCPFCMTERGDFGDSDDEEEPVEDRIRKLVEEAIEEANRQRRAASR